MEWYIGVIMILSAAFVVSLVFIINMMSVIDGLRIDNSKLDLEVVKSYDDRKKAELWGYYKDLMKLSGYKSIASLLLAVTHKGQ